MPLAPSDQDAKNIYALLVGINEYPFPISTLRGCIEDIERVEKYLRINFGGDPSKISASTGKDLTIEKDGRLHLCILKDQQATYSNIIRGFREHLQQAGPNDSVWFHFSGHGTESFTAKEFYQSIEPNGKDQSLICYREPIQPGQRLLADKELAVLLHEVATANGKASPPHMIVSLDCCHSGSGTRYFHTGLEIKTRNVHLRKATNWQEAEASGEARSLDTYLSGYFVHNKLELPVAKHILFSACESVQTAGDTSSGGIFTNSLMDALEGVRGEINYADLFVRTRASAYRLRAEQTPQFETIGGFDPYTQFLSGIEFGRPDRYHLVFENKTWMVKCGAIHGLPVDSKHPIEVDIYRQGESEEKIASAKITAVGAQKSRLVDLEGTLEADEEGRHFYQAVIRYLPAAPFQVLLKGDDEQKLQRLIEGWDTSKSIHWVKEEALEEHNQPLLEVEIREGKYLLKDLRNRRLAQVLSGPKASLRWVLIDLGKMVSWERVLTLDHPKSAIRDWVELGMGLIFKNHRLAAYQGEEIRIYADENNFMRKEAFLVAGFVPHLKVVQPKQKLYAYLLNLRSNYSISAKEGEVVFRPEEHATNQPIKVPLYKKPLGWGFSGDENEAIAYFKLLITTEELEYYQLVQDGIDAFRFEAVDWKPVGVTGDWCSINMKIHLIRQTALRGDMESLSLGNGKLQIRPNGVVNAKVSLSTARRIQESPEPGSKLPGFESSEWTLMDFSSETDNFQQNLLEFGFLQLDQAQLEKNPMDILIQEPLEPGETILAVAFDGQDFKVIGRSEEIEGLHRIRISEIPERFNNQADVNKLVPNPFLEDNIQHCSLYSRWKIGFYRGQKGANFNL
jgi:hypothetical protein